MRWREVDDCGFLSECLFAAAAATEGGGALVKVPRLRLGEVSAMVTGWGAVKVWADVGAIVSACQLHAAGKCRRAVKGQQWTLTPDERKIASVQTADTAVTVTLFARRSRSSTSDG